MLEGVSIAWLVDQRACVAAMTCLPVLAYCCWPFIYYPYIWIRADMMLCGSMTALLAIIVAALETLV
jgi:hypothetical protein